MKNLIKAASLLVVIGTLTYTACKKSENNPSKTSSAAQLSMSRQLALSIYKSLAQQSVKTSGYSKQRILSTSLCGQVITTPTNSTVTIGDTIRTITGNTIFTYVCSNDTLNGYTLADTMRVTEKGGTFNNSFLVTQNYLVKLVDARFGSSRTDGTMTAANHISKVNASNVVTEFHDFSAQYTLTGVGFIKQDANLTHFGGTIKFASQEVDKDSTTAANGNTINFTGTIIFIEAGFAWCFSTMPMVAKHPIK